MRNQLRSLRVDGRLLIPAVLALSLLGSSLAVAQTTGPHLAYVFPPGGQRGTTVEVSVRGRDLQGASEVRVSGKGVTASVVEVLKPAEKPKTPKRLDASENPDIVRISVTIAADAEIGQRDLRLITPAGASNRFRFVVGQVPELKEVEPNSTKDEAQSLESLPVLINGQILQADTDFFRFTAKAGQTLVCEVQARKVLPYIADAVPGWLQSSLTLYDSGGNELAYVDDFHLKPDPVLIYNVEKDGQYLIEIKDVLYRGREDLIYRLSIGVLPYITHIYPLGGRRDSTVLVELGGVNLPAENVDVAIPTDSPPLRHVQLSHNGLRSNVLPFGVGDMREEHEAEPNDSMAQANRIEMPVTINGRIRQSGDTDYFILSAQAKQELVMEVKARRLDSPLDSILTLLNPKGRQLAENDDTVDPAEPLITHHADSRLVYTFPSAGDYILRVRDVQGKGGDEYAYRLLIAPPRPDYALLVTPDNPRVGQGGTAALTVSALRKDGFSGEIKLSVQDLPEGFLVSEASIPADQDQMRLTITAPPDAPTGVSSPTIVGTATIGDQEAVRKAVAAEELMQAFSLKQNVPTEEFLLAVIEPASFTLSVDVPPGEVLQVAQGSNVQVVVKAIRREGTKGAIRLSADAPPRGISVRPAAIPANEDEATITLAALKQAPVGFRQNIIITGTLRVGKETITGVAPAIPIEVVAPQK